MDTPIQTYSASELVSSMRPVIESADALNQVLTDALEEMRKIQSESCAAAFAESMLSLAPAFAPGGAPHSVWQIPSLYQTQAERMVQSMLDSFEVLSQSQQKILELMGKSLSQSAQQTAKAISHVNETFSSRRVSAQIIDFSDRRAKAKAESKVAGDAPAEHKTHHHMGKKSAG